MKAWRSISLDQGARQQPRPQQVHLARLGVCAALWLLTVLSLRVLGDWLGRSTEAVPPVMVGLGCLAWLLQGTLLGWAAPRRWPIILLALLTLAALTGHREGSQWIADAVAGAPVMASAIRGTDYSGPIQWHPLYALSAIVGACGQAYSSHRRGKIAFPWTQLASLRAK